MLISAPLSFKGLLIVWLFTDLAVLIFIVFKSLCGLSEAKPSLLEVWLLEECCFHRFKVLFLALVWFEDEKVAVFISMHMMGWSLLFIRLKLWILL